MSTLLDDDEADVDENQTPDNAANPSSSSDLPRLHSLVQVSPGKVDLNESLDIEQRCQRVVNADRECGTQDDAYRRHQPVLGQEVTNDIDLASAYRTPCADLLCPLADGEARQTHDTKTRHDKQQDDCAQQGPGDGFVAFVTTGNNLFHRANVADDAIAV